MFGKLKVLITEWLSAVADAASSKVASTLEGVFPASGVDLADLAGSSLRRNVCPDCDAAAAVDIARTLELHLEMRSAVFQCKSCGRGYLYDSRSGEASAL